MPLPARILPDRPTHRSDLGADLLQPIVLESSEDGTDLRLLPQFRARLRLNQSSAEALEAIPGLSARAARNLVEYRRTHGPFQDLQELLEVQGIGPATLAKLQDFVVLDGVQAAGAKD